MKKAASLLGGSFLLSACNLTLFGRMSIRYNMQMHQIEKNAGEGLTTIGKLIQRNKLENDDV